MSKSLRLGFDSLEDRCTPASFGVAWSDPTHLTISFAPDGAQIGGHVNVLNSSLNAQMPTAVWQREILRAFQTWAAAANLEIGLVADSGDAFGAPGKQQHDPRFGDVRIGAQKMASDSLAVGVSNAPFYAGTWAGDVFFNANNVYNGTTVDLFAIALHEAGHALGLGHSDDPNSAMYSHHNVRRTLSASDVQSIQALYGQRGPDVWEGSNGNDTTKTATRLKYSVLSSGYDGSRPLVTFGEISNAADLDVFSLRPLPGYNGPVTFRVRSAGLSMLRATATIFDDRGAVLATLTGQGEAGGDLKFTAAQLDPNRTYYVRVAGAARDDFGVGRFAVVATFDRLNAAPEALLEQVLRGPYDAFDAQQLDKVFQAPSSHLLADDLHTNDDAALANRLKSTPGYASGAHYETVASLSALDIDYYSVRAPKNAGAKPYVLTITAAGLELQGATPLIEVFDATGAPVAARILVNGNGTYIVQVTNVQRNQDFTIRLSGTADVVGNYSLIADFGTESAPNKTFAAGTFGNSQPAQSYSLFVARTQLAQWNLSVAGPAGAAVRVVLRDAAGNIVASLTGFAGQTLSLPTTLINPGEYRVTFESASAIPLAGASYTLSGDSVSDGVGPVVDDPTSTPQYVNPTDPTTHIYPDGTITSQTFWWLLLLV